MLRPKNVKFKKHHRRSLTRVSNNNTYLSFGQYGLKSLEGGSITEKTIETSRRTITRTFKRRGKVWIRIVPDLPVTAKPSEARLGKGVGSISHWTSVVKKGEILFEFSGVPRNLAEEAAIAVNKKLNIKTCFVC